MTEQLIKVEFPIEIGIIGAPNSGKSKLIKEFVKLSKPWFAENNQKMIVHGNIGTDIESRYDQAMGVYGDYRENLWAFFARLAAEKKIRNDGNNFISNGTMIDTLAHAGINMETVMLGLQTSGLVTPDTQAEVQKLQMAMNVLTFLFVENFQYKFVFYLPLPEQIVIPGEDDSEQRYSQRIDNAIQVIFQNFNLRIQMLDQPTHKEKAEEMLSTIKRIMDEGVVLEIPTEEDLPEPVGQTETDTPEDFNQVVSEILTGKETTEKSPCGCGENGEVK